MSCRTYRIGGLKLTFKIFNLILQGPVALNFGAKNRYCYEDTLGLYGQPTAIRFQRPAYKQASIIPRAKSGESTGAPN